MERIFEKKYSVLEMFFGEGQSTFENLNDNKIIELDFFDIYFAYVFISLIFIIYVSYILLKSKLKSISSNIYIYSSYTNYISIFFIVLSLLSVHIFNSAISVIYIGCVFSLTYYKSRNENTIS